MNAAAARPLISVHGLDSDMATDQSSTVVLPDVMTAPEEKNKEENIGSSCIGAKVEGLEKVPNQWKELPANVIARRFRAVARKLESAALDLESAARRPEKAAIQLRIAAIRAAYGKADPDPLPEVRILSLAILSPGTPDIVLSVPENGNPKEQRFTLKEGSKYNLKFTFQVNKSIVSGLRYSNTVWKYSDPHWKYGLKVGKTKETIGTFSPQSAPYNHETTTPSGIFAPGSYYARTKVVDDDNICYFEIFYMFDILKEWPAV